MYSGMIIVFEILYLQLNDNCFWNILMYSEMMIVFEKYCMYSEMMIVIFENGMYSEMIIVLE